MYKLFYNKNCSKSLKCLKILINRKIKFKTVLYMEKKLSFQDIKEIINNLESPVNTILRKDILNYSTDNQLINILLKNPNYMQRPIFYDTKQYIICRPPEKLLRFMYMVEGVGFEPT